jgi:PmbA protein
MKLHIQSDSGVTLIENIFIDRYMPGANGEFSGVAKNSFLIERGKITGAVTETMVNGNLGEAFRRIKGVSKEVLCDGGSVVPWIAVDGIVISGK